MPSVVNGSRDITTLNESPSEKEGKYVVNACYPVALILPQ